MNVSNGFLMYSESLLQEYLLILVSKPAWPPNPDRSPSSHHRMAAVSHSSIFYRGQTRCSRCLSVRSGATI